jgi:proteasome lid subunit RPN8/RPN11
MINLPPQIMKKMCFHAERLYPEECCGMLLGSHREGLITVHDAIEMASLEEVHRDQRYLLTPAQYSYAEKVANESHADLIGFYHSHPDRKAVPSLYDLENALPWFVYLIVAVYHQHSDERVTGWTLSENRQRFDEQTMHIH